MLALAIALISSNFPPWDFELLQYRLGCWCIHQAGWDIQSLFYWRNWWWQGLRRSVKISMFPPLQHSCEHLWSWGIHVVSVSSLWLGNRPPSDWGLVHYHLVGHLLSQPPWGLSVWCGGSGLYEWPFHINGCHVHHRRLPVGWACFIHRNSWNTSLPSFNHPCTYNLMVYCGIPSIL